MTQSKTPFYRTALKQELVARCGANSSYSLRSYARSLRVSPGLLSEVLSSKKALSLKVAQRLVENINLSPIEEKRFLNSVVEEQRSRGLQRLNPEVKSYNISDLPLTDLSLDYYRFISEWYHVTILEMLQLKSFSKSPEWIAKELGIKPIEAKVALERLIEFGFIKELEDGSLVKSDEHLRIKDMYSATSSARRKKQKQIRQKAILAIDEQNVDKRLMTTMTFAVDPERLPEAKIKIQEFNESMCKHFDTEDKKEIYVMAVSLFSLHK